MVGLRSVLMWGHLLFLLDLNQCLFIAAPFFVMYTFSFRPCRSWLDPLGVHRRTAMWCWLCGVDYKDLCREGCDPDFPPCFDKLFIHVLAGETLKGAATVRYALLMKETADRDSPSGLRVTAVVPKEMLFQYGHSDIFDRIFHLTRGGISKASKVIDFNTEIFSGFNSCLRGGYISHHEYIQVGKGRAVGMNQISVSEALDAKGNGEQTLNRAVYRLGRGFDFFRMLSFYFTTIGVYFSSMVALLVLYVFLYGRLYVLLSGLERAIFENASIHQNRTFKQVLAHQSVFQLGLLLALPMVMEICLERGFCSALSNFIIMQLQLVSVFFTFQLGTKAHYYGRTILHGGFKHYGTSGGLVPFHVRFADNYRLYSRSHFVKALELIILLLVYQIYEESYCSSSPFWFITFSMWFLVASWLFAPFVFNPSGVEWQKTMDDWADWKRWMGSQGHIGFHPNESWGSWWDGEQEHLKNTDIRGTGLEIILALRFFLYQYGIVCHLIITHHGKSFLVYGLSWVVNVLLFKMVSIGRPRICNNSKLKFSALKGLLFLCFISVMIILVLVCGLTISDLFAMVFSFVPTGWGILLIAQACKPLFKRLGLWDSIENLARAYEYMMGLIIFIPLLILSWFPFISVLQTRLLFLPAFSKGIQISMILAGKSR